jgi:N6-adenosine-specific RNA methylase IME4
MDSPARVLLADPPWKFGDALPGAGRGAAKHYPCMSVEELKSFQLPELASDCLLLLWRVAAMQSEALEVARAWGFTIKAEVVWLKQTRLGKRWFGMGRYVRAAHEVCLIGVRGRVQVADRSVRSVFDAVALEHSRKPDAIYEIAERLVPGGPYVELFARRARAGWLCLGNEVANGLVA